MTSAQGATGEGAALSLTSGAVNAGQNPHGAKGGCVEKLPCEGHGEAGKCAGGEETTVPARRLCHRRRHPFRCSGTPCVPKASGGVGMERASGPGRKFRCGAVPGFGGGRLDRHAFAALLVSSAGTLTPRGAASALNGAGPGSQSPKLTTDGCLARSSKTPSRAGFQHLVLERGQHPARLDQVFRLPSMRGESAIETRL